MAARKTVARAPKAPKLHPLYAALVKAGCVLCRVCTNYMPAFHLCTPFVSGALRLDPATGEWTRGALVIAAPGVVNHDPAFALQAIDGADDESAMQVAA